MNVGGSTEPGGCFGWPLRGIGSRVGPQQPGKSNQPPADGAASSPGRRTSSEAKIKLDLASTEKAAKEVNNIRLQFLQCALSPRMRQFLTAADEDAAIYHGKELQSVRGTTPKVTHKADYFIRSLYELVSKRLIAKRDELSGFYEAGRFPEIVDLINLQSETAFAYERQTQERIKAMEEAKVPPEEIRQFRGSADADTRTFVLLCLRSAIDELEKLKT
jgi:hypothetical protein